MKTVKQACRCEKCGNEAEMELTCSMEDYDKAVKEKKAAPKEKKELHILSGRGVCVNCGNEADMWIDV